MICPPLVINQEELDYGLSIIEEALTLVDEMLSVVGAAAD